MTPEWLTRSVIMANVRVEPVRGTLELSHPPREFYLTQMSRSRPPALYTTLLGGAPTTSKYSLPVA